MRFLMDREALDSEAGRIMIARTLVKVCAVVFSTVVLPGLGTGWKTDPRLLYRAGKTGSEEMAGASALSIAPALRPLPRRLDWFPV